MRSAVGRARLNCENTAAAIATCHVPAFTTQIVWPKPTLPRRGASRGERSHRYAAKNCGSLGSAKSGRNAAPTVGPGAWPAAGAAARRAIVNHRVARERRMRSEERRVGKECRYRWSRDHLIKE